MLKVLVVGYDKMLNALVSGCVYSGHKVVGAMRVDRVNYSKFALFFKDIFNPSMDLSILKAFGIYDVNAPSVNSAEFIAEVKKLKPDVILVGSWGEKIDTKISKLIPFGIINCHPSLLPKHRGANPYFWAIYQGDKTTGVTFHLINEKFDCGDILLQEAVPIDYNMTGGELKNRCSKFAQGLVSGLLEKLEKGKIHPKVQDENLATYENQLKYKDTVVNLNRNRFDIHNHIRALKPWYVPIVKLGLRKIEIYSHKFLPLNQKYQNVKIGEIIFENRKKIIARTFDSLIEISKK